MGSSLFTVVQYGKEGTRGTAVAATKIWPGKANKVLTDAKPAFIEEQLGVRSKVRRVNVYQKLYRDSLMTDQATFSQLIFPFQCGLKGNITPTEVTPSQSDYLHTFTPSLTAANNPDTATIELGDDAQYWEVEYCMFDKYVISGSIDQEGGDAPVSLEASFFGRQLTNTTKTAALSLPAGEFMNAKNARLYLDTAWAGVGVTEQSNLLRAFNLQILTGTHPDSTGSANKYFNAHKEGEISANATITIEGGSGAASLLGLQQAGTFRVMRLAINGSQIGSGTTHNLTVDIGGYFEQVTPIDGDDRTDNLATFALRGAYDTTGAKLLQVTVTTNSNTAF